MTNSIIFFIGMFVILIALFFIMFSTIRENQKIKEENEVIKKAYSKTIKYTEEKKENEKKIKDIESTRGADSVNNAFDLLHNVSKKGQERNGK